MEAQNILEEVARDVAQCGQCDLHYSRKKAVAGEGPADARILFIGEGPGFYENEQGRPFVGPAGKFLDELLAKIGMKRDEVFITNVVKCRPPSNRDPQPGEVDLCTKSFLDRQISAINPKVIVTLGRFSMGLFMSGASISHVHGQSMWVRGRLIVPMYHPAAALHQQSLKPVVEQDFSNLPEMIEKAMANGPAFTAPAIQAVEKEKPEAKQLSLF